jgi:hypothetical protein
MKCINLDKFEFVEGGKEKLIAEFKRVFETSDLALCDTGEGMLLLVSPKLIQEAIRDAVGSMLLEHPEIMKSEGDKDAS